MAESKPSASAVATQPPEGDRPEPAGHAFSLDFPATLTAIVRPEEGGGFSAEVPGLVGCFTEADTIEELRENLAEAARGWLEAHQELAAREASGGAGGR